MGPKKQNHKSSAAASRPTLLLLDNARDTITRYVDGHAVERFNITNRQEFDRSFDTKMAERVRRSLPSRG